MKGVKGAGQLGSVDVILVMLLAVVTPAEWLIGWKVGPNVE